MPQIWPSSEVRLRQIDDAELERLLREANVFNPRDFQEGDPSTWPAQVIAREIDRRVNAAQAAALTRLTWAIAAMTLISTVFVVLSTLHVVR